MGGASEEEVKADVEKQIAAAGIGRGSLADFTLKIEPAEADGNVNVSITRVGEGQKEDEEDGELTDEEITEAVRASNLVEEVTVEEQMAGTPVTDPSQSASALFVSIIAVAA